MNMQSLMAQAQKMQNDLNKSTKELESTTFESTIGVVKITATGKKELTSIKIMEEVDDIEILEDMILTAVNNVMKEIDKEKEKKLGKYASALGGIL